MSAVPRLIQRARAPEISRRSLQAPILASLDAEDLIREYDEVREWAPRRGLDGHSYFLERTKPPQSKDNRRGEQRLAMALARASATVTVGGESVDLLGYAFPLFTTGGKSLVSDVDLIGHSQSSNRLWAIELKARHKETPVRALFEVLIYSAVIEANLSEIHAELESWERAIGATRPGMLIAAPSEYWDGWQATPRMGDWWGPYQEVTVALSHRLGAPLETVSLGQIWFENGEDGWPRLVGEFACAPVAYPA